MSSFLYVLKIILRSISIAILAIILLLVIFLFWGSTSSIADGEYAEIIVYDSIEIPLKDTITVLTYNIGWLSGMTNNLALERPEELYKENLAKAIVLLKHLKPDIAAIQEIDYDAHRSYNYNQMDSIAKYVDFYYGAKAINWDKNYVPFPYWPVKYHFKKVVSGQAILSNYEISEQERVVLKKPEDAPFYWNAFYLDRLAQVAKLYINDTIALYIINVHLEAWDEQARQQQAQTVIEIYKKYADDHPVLLLGDFNAEPPMDAYVDTEKYEATMKTFFDMPGLRSATIQNFSDTAKVDFTYSSSEPTKKIDYIFYNERFVKMHSARVVKEAGEISDHFPVLMRFSIIQ